MTRKRFIKLQMSSGIPRNRVRRYVERVLTINKGVDWSNQHYKQHGYSQREPRLSYDYLWDSRFNLN